MKKVVIYFSMTENTAYVAKKIAQLTGADLLSVEPVKNYPKKGPLKYFFGGMHAARGINPELKPYDFDSSLYDTVIFASPVWASQVAPPVKSFVEQNKENLKGKKFALYTGYRGNGAVKAAENFAKFLGIEKFEKHLFLTDPLQWASPKKEAKIEEFCKSLI